MVEEIAIGQIIQDFSVIMIIASAMAFISYKLKQPLVIGYIIAGIIIGPHTNNKQQKNDTHFCKQIANIVTYQLLY